MELITMTYKLETSQGSFVFTPSDTIPWSALVGVTLTLSFEDGTQVKAEIDDFLGVSQGDNE
jgi:hypothetical protein